MGLTEDPGNFAGADQALGASSRLEDEGTVCAGTAEALGEGPDGFLYIFLNLEPSLGDGVFQLPTGTGCVCIAPDGGMEAVEGTGGGGVRP